MSPTSYQAALPRVIPSLLSATVIIIPYSNGFVKRVRKVFLQQKQRTKTRLLTFFPESQQPRQFTPLREGRLYRASLQWKCRYFNSRPSARGDKSAALFEQHRQIFQFTPLREGRRGYWCIQAQRGLYFNSRPSARGDSCKSCFGFWALNFNSRPSARGDPKASPTRRLRSYFNSRPFARGDHEAEVHVPV